MTKVLVGTRGLIAISRAHHGEIWDETQRWNGLNGLMGGAILSDLNSPKLPKLKVKTGSENKTSIYRCLKIKAQKGSQKAYCSDRSTCRLGDTVDTLHAS